MQLVSWGLTFLVWFAPMVLGVILLVGAGTLHMRVKSRATLAFFVGMLVTALAPWVLQFVFGGPLNRGAGNIIQLVSVVALAVQSFGLLFYALSVPKLAQEN